MGMGSSLALGLYTIAILILVSTSYVHEMYMYVCTVYSAQKRKQWQQRQAWFWDDFCGDFWSSNMFLLVGTILENPSCSSQREWVIWPRACPVAPFSKRTPHLWIKIHLQPHKNSFLLTSAYTSSPNGHSVWYMIAVIKIHISFYHPQEDVTGMITCSLSHACVIYWRGKWHLSL